MSLLSLPMNSQYSNHIEVVVRPNEWVTVMLDKLPVAIVTNSNGGRSISSPKSASNNWNDDKVNKPLTITINREVNNDRVIKRFTLSTLCVRHITPLLTYSNQRNPTPPDTFNFDIEFIFRGHAFSMGFVQSDERICLHNLSKIIYPVPTDNSNELQLRVVKYGINKTTFTMTESFKINAVCLFD